MGRSLIEDKAHEDRVDCNDDGVAGFSGTGTRESGLNAINSMCSVAARNWRTSRQKC